MFTKTISSLTRFPTEGSATTFMVSVVVFLRFVISHCKVISPAAFAVTDAVLLLELASTKELVLPDFQRITHGHYDLVVVIIPVIAVSANNGIN